MVDRPLQSCTRCGAVDCRCGGRHRLPRRIQALDCTKGSTCEAWSQALTSEIGLVTKRRQVIVHIATSADGYIIDSAAPS